VLIIEDVALILLAVKYVKLPIVDVTLLPLKLPVIPAYAYTESNIFATPFITRDNPQIFDPEI
jgi:hypothetical protein